MDTNNNKLNIYDITVFKDNANLAYLYKKTEKLVSALYMLSSFISDKEPVKWQMREASLELLPQSLFLSDKNTFVASILKFLSFLEVSYAGGVISKMNYDILKYEFESLIQITESSDKLGNAKDNFRITVCIRGMDVDFGDIVIV